MTALLIIAVAFVAVFLVFFGWLGTLGLMDRRALRKQAEREANSWAAPLIVPRQFKPYVPPPWRPSNDDLDELPPRDTPPG